MKKIYRGKVVVPSKDKMGRIVKELKSTDNLKEKIIEYANEF